MENSSFSDLELVERILYELENKYFLGKKQINKLREINQASSPEEIDKLIDKWSFYLSETLYNDKFTKDFLIIVFKQHIKIP